MRWRSGHVQYHSSLGTFKDLNNEAQMGVCESVCDCRFSTDRCAIGTVPRGAYQEGTFRRRPKVLPQTDDASTKKVSKPPNVIVLLVDDLGYGDLGIQGNESLSTPNIDRIGKEGVRFTRWLSASAICTPSRASFMTGRYAQRYGMASSGRNTRVMAPSAPGGLPHSETTFSEVLREIMDIRPT